MHLFPRFVAILLLGTASLHPSTLADSTQLRDPLRVVAWNIEWFPGKAFEPSLEEQAKQIQIAQKTIREIDPDILIASEIRDWAAFEEVVRAVPGLRIHVVSNFRSTDTGEIWRQQVAIASRLPCKAAWAEDFEPTIPALTRGFAFAALIDPATQKYLMVYGVHFKSNRSRNEEEANLNYRLRDESAAQVLTHMETMGRVTFGHNNIRGWIFGGDMNTNNDAQFGDNVISTFEKAGFWNTWKNTPREKRLTWRGSSQFEATTFDYIFLKGLGQPEAVLLEVPPEASDHHAVLTEVSLQEK